MKKALLGLGIVFASLALIGPALGQCVCPCPCTRGSPVMTHATMTPATLFGWRNDISKRLDKLEGRQQAPAPGSDQAALIAQLQMQIVQLNAQIAELQRRQSPSAPTAPINHYHIYSPGGPPIALNPNPGPVIPLNPNPGPPIALNPNPGPVIPLNPNPGPVIPLNPNPGPPIQLIPNPGAPIPLNPNPAPKTAPPPPTGYQTFTPYVATSSGWRPAYAQSR